MATGSARILAFLVGSSDGVDGQKTTLIFLKKLKALDNCTDFSEGNFAHMLLKAACRFPPPSSCDRESLSSRFPRSRLPVGLFFKLLALHIVDSSDLLDIYLQTRSSEHIRTDLNVFFMLLAFP